jgi:hypothetical protein
MDIPLFFNLLLLSLELRAEYRPLKCVCNLFSVCFRSLIYAEMSFRAPNPFRKGGSRSRLLERATNTPSSSPRRLVEVNETFRPPRRPYGSKGLSLPVEEILYGPNGRVYTEIPGAPNSTDSRRIQSSRSVPNDSPMPLGEFGEYDELHSDLHDRLHETFNYESAESRQGKASKAQKQFLKWTNEVIPSLVQPYLYILRKSNSFRHPLTAPLSLSCHCGSSSTHQVVCVYFESMSYHRYIHELYSYISLAELEKITVKSCSCSSIALQLLSRGLFPCAPSKPTLAVDLNMLKFVQELFVHNPPNTTAWSDTLESFLGDRQYKLQTRVRQISTHVFASSL